MIRRSVKSFQAEGSAERADRVPWRPGTINFINLMISAIIHKFINQLTFSGLESRALNCRSRELKYVFPGRSDQSRWRTKKKDSEDSSQLRELILGLNLRLLDVQASFIDHGTNNMPSDSSTQNLSRYDAKWHFLDLATLSDAGSSRLVIGSGKDLFAWLVWASPLRTLLWIQKCFLSATRPPARVMYVACIIIGWLWGLILGKFAFLTYLYVTQLSALREWYFARWLKWTLRFRNCFASSPKNNEAQSLTLHKLARMKISQWLCHHGYWITIMIVSPCPTVMSTQAPVPLQVICSCSEPTCYSGGKNPYEIHQLRPLLSSSHHPKELSLLIDRIPPLLQTKNSREQ